MKALKTKLRLKKKQYVEMKRLCYYSKNLYNQANYLIKQYWKYTGSYLNYYDMDYVMKGRSNLDGKINYRLLKAKVSQQVLRKLDKNWLSFFRSMKDWKKFPIKYKGMPRPPKYLKEYNNLVYDYQAFTVKEKCIKLVKNIKINIPVMLKNEVIKQIEIIPKEYHFDVVYVYEDKVDYKQVKESGNVMGIDLGLNNLAACVSNVIEPFIVNGRPIKSINQYYNKKRSKISSCLEKRNKSKTSKKLKHLLHYRSNKVNDYLHKVSRLVVNKCVENKISTVVVGDVSKSLSKIKLGKRNNQNFVNISLGQFIYKLKYKLEHHNIKLKLTDERYTSKCSFIDNDKLPSKIASKGTYEFSGRRVKRGLYRTANKVLINADVNGAYNIVRKVVKKFNINLLKDLIEGNSLSCWLHPHKLNV